MLTSKKELWQGFARTVAAQTDSANPAKRAFVDDSWQRSRAAGIGRSRKLFSRVEDSILQERLQEHGGWLRVAIPLLENFSQQLRIRHVVYVTAPDGIVLHSAGSPTWRVVQGLLPGFDWSEKVMGTNGAGTALATNQPVAVIGPEHYIEDFSRCTCLAAPLHAPAGKLIGAVDLSTAVEDARPEQLWDVISLAQEIETGYGKKSEAATASE